MLAAERGHPADVRRLVPKAIKLRYHALLRALSRLVDRVLGIDTAERVDLADFGLAHPERVNYEAGSWLDLPRVLRHIPVRRHDVLLDLGCGKGRALVMAARHPFARVIGVELSPELARVAERNLEASRLPRRCRAVEVVVADAVEYRIPDDVTFVYLFNPFRGRVFDAVIERIVESVDRAPRRVRVIYRNAMYEDRLLGTGRAHLQRVLPGLRPTRRWREAVGVRVYAVDPGRRPVPVRAGSG